LGVERRFGGFLEYTPIFSLEQATFSMTGLHSVKQAGVAVLYEGKNVGAYFADWVVVDLVIVELKACADLLEENEAQLTNYVRVTDIEVGLLLNFGRNPKKKRKAFSNEYKIKGPGLKTLERNEGHFYKCNLFHLSNLYNLRSGKILKDGAL